MHNCATVTYALGQVISTRDYKVIRFSHPDGSQPLLCDIITLDGSTVGRWRRKPNPPGRLMRVRGTMESLALNGVLHFLYDAEIMESGSIASFNLETEEWMPTLRGPQPLRSLVFHRCGVIDRMLSLANLNGCLVTVECSWCQH
uniref:F-box associated domain-containing protein n=1 Tax=Arundo donax TaxID=35708 RepID=A0A0A9FT79_ARUDO